MTPFDIVATEAFSVKDSVKKVGKTILGIGAGAIVVCGAVAVSFIYLPLALVGIGVAGCALTAYGMDRVVDKFRKNKKYVKQHYSVVKFKKRINHCDSMYWSDKLPEEKTN